MSDVTQFYIETSAVGINKIVIGAGEDQLDVTDIMSEVQINTGNHDKPTLVYMKQKPGEGTVVGEGVIYVEKEKISALHIVETIDPTELTEAVMAAQEWGSDKPLAELILAEIVERIHAAQS